MGKESPRKNIYAEGEPTQHAKPKMRLHKPLIVQPGLSVHPKTLEKFGEALKEQDENVWLNAHLKKESIPFLQAELEKAKQHAKKLYAQRIERGEVSQEELDVLLDKITPTIYAEARSVIQFLEDGGVVSKNASVDIVGYSQGGPAVVFAAVLRPDLFRNSEEEQSTIVLLNSAGLTGKREFGEKHPTVGASKKVAEDRESKIDDKEGRVKRHIEIVVGYLGALLREGVSKPGMQKALLDGIGHVFAQFGGRVHREAHEMANTDLVPFINFLVRSNELRVVVVYDEQDTAFSPKVIESRKEAGDFDGGVEFYKTNDGGHFDPIHNPTAVAADIEHVLRSKKKSEEEK